MWPITHVQSPWERQPVILSAYSNHVANHVDYEDSQSQKWSVRTPKIVIIIPPNGRPQKYISSPSRTVPGAEDEARGGVAGVHCHLVPPARQVCERVQRGDVTYVSGTSKKTQESTRSMTSLPLRWCDNVSPGFFHAPVHIYLGYEMYSSNKCTVATHVQ